MMNDDDFSGYLLTRRETLAFLGSAGLLALTGCSNNESTTPISNNPLCVVRPQLTEGPYFVDEKLNRSDIRSDPSDGSIKDGAQLQLKLNVSQMQSNECIPLANAQIDLWHCDALGNYSDVSDPHFNTKGQKFLRGFQLTDANGTADFTTIYPGWYQGRALHLHFKIRSSSGEFTSQFFFDDDLSDQVHSQMPYAVKGQRTLRNEGDGIYRQNGSQLVLDVKKENGGYAAIFNIALG